MSRHYTPKIIICSVLRVKKKPHRQFDSTVVGLCVMRTTNFMSFKIFSNSRGLNQSLKRDILLFKDP